LASYCGTIASVGELHAPGDQLLHHPGAAAERNAVHGGAGELFELPGENLLRRAGADGRVADLAGMRLGVLHERLEIVGGNGVGERKPVIVFGNERDRGDIA